MKTNFIKLHLFALVLLALSLQLTRAEKVMRPKLQNVTLWSDEKFVTHDIQMDSSDPHLNLTLNVLQPLHNLDIHIEATIVQKLDPDYFFTVNTTINICEIINYNSKSPLGILFVSYLKDYGHVLEKCPIVKGSYYLRKYWPPEDTTLAHLPEVDFDIFLTAFHIDASKQKTEIIKDHLTGEIVVRDVKKVKPGILTLLSKVSG